MNVLLKAEVKQLQRTFMDFPKVIVEKDTEDGGDCDWIMIQFDEKNKGHLFLCEDYPCRYVTVYPPNKLHFNKKTLEMEAVFFTSDCISDVVENMVLEYKAPPRKIFLGSNFHKSYLKTKQARSFYDQYREQAERPGDHDGIYRVTFTDRENAKADNDAALLALKLDHEKILGLAKIPKCIIDGNVITIKGKPWTQAEKKKAYEDLENCVAALIQGTEDKADIYKAAIIYDRIVEMRNASTEEADDYDFTGPVQKGHGCCSGYAKLAKYAFNKAGLPCVIVHGDHHAWNMALINGKLAFFDAMWEYKNRGRRYFALTVDEMEKDHKLHEMYFKEVL